MSRSKFILASKRNLAAGRLLNGINAVSELQLLWSPLVRTDRIHEYARCSRETFNLILKQQAVKISSTVKALSLLISCISYKNDWQSYRNWILPSTEN